jgi:hypothetical protein
MILKTLFFAKRVGLHWEVWSAYDDGRKHTAIGKSEWVALNMRFWNFDSACKIAFSMQCAFDEGVFSSQYAAAKANVSNAA